MLLIVTVGLVLAGIVLLVIGLISTHPGYIYISMACAVLAALTLFIFSRLSRRSAGPSDRSEGAGADARASAAPGATAAPDATTDDTRVVTGPGVSTETTDAPETGTTAAPDTDAKDPTLVSGQPAGTDRAAPGAGGGRAPAPTVGAEEPQPDAAAEDDAGIEDDEGIEHDAAIDGAGADEHGEDEKPGVLPPVTVGAGLTGEPEGESEDWDDDEWDDEFVFPIEDYDDLRVAEILPILAELENDELTDVRDREAAGKARGTILRRIEALLGASPEAAPASAAPLPAAPAPAAPAPAAPVRVPRTAPAPPPPPAPPAPPASRRRSAAKVREPIPGYESLRVAQILPLLGELSHPDLATIEATERAGANRGTILKRIDRLRAGAPRGVDELDGAEAAPATVAPVRAAGRGVPTRSTGKAAAKKPAPGRRAPTKAATAPVPDPAAPPPEAAPALSAELAPDPPTQAASGAEAEAVPARPARRAVKKRR